MSTLRFSVALSLPVTLSLLATSACGGATAGTSGDDTAPAAGEGGAGEDTSSDGGSEPEAASNVTAIPLFSCDPTAYTLSATIGNSQKFQLTLDTGSTTLGVASQACSECTEAPKPLYDPGTTAVDEHKTAASQYGSGSWTGEIYKDSVGIGASASTSVALVAIDTQSHFFVPLQCDSKPSGMQGIIGFGPAVSALPGTSGFFDDYVASEKVPNVFATELCDSGGTLWLGGYDPAATTAAPQYTPLLGGEGAGFYYSVNLVSIAVNGTTVPIATSRFTDSIVDTGTGGILLGAAAYDAITTAIAASPAFQTMIAADASWFGSPNCARPTQTKAQIDAALPSLTMTFGSNPAISVQALPSESYLSESQGGLWCPTLASFEQGDQFFQASILGAPILRSNVVIFDRAQQRIGFAPHKACP